MSESIIFLVLLPLGLTIFLRNSWNSFLKLTTFPSPTDSPKVSKPIEKWAFAIIILQGLHFFYVLLVRKTVSRGDRILQNIVKSNTLIPSMDPPSQMIKKVNVHEKVVNKIEHQTIKVRNLRIRSNLILSCRPRPQWVPIHKVITKWMFMRALSTRNRILSWTEAVEFRGCLKV